MASETRWVIPTITVARNLCIAGDPVTQDFRTAPTGGTASVLMIPDVFNGFAFWVPGSIWPTYLGQGGGGGWMGYPLGNQEFVPSQSCGGALESSQKFQSGYII